MTFFSNSIMNNCTVLDEFKIPTKNLSSPLHTDFSENLELESTQSSIQTPSSTSEYRIIIDIDAFRRDMGKRPNTMHANASSVDLVPQEIQFFKKPSSPSNQTYALTPRILPIHKERLLSKIRNCCFEAGVWTIADAYFKDLIQIYNSIQAPLTLLSDIVNHNLSDQHLLEGILHILSNYNYEDINPVGITIALCCINNRSPIIQERLISCYENWNSSDGIDTLQSLQLDDVWLDDYRNEVIGHLNAIT